MNNFKNKIISIVSFAGVLAIFLGATYAYLTNHFKDNLEAPIEVTAHTTDSLIFSINNDITITALPENFDQGMGNQFGEIKAKAILKANSKTNSTTMNYFVYFDIKENELKYTTEEKYAEIVLQVTDPNGNVYDSDDLTGLNYVTVTDGRGEQISGFDITEIKGVIAIADNYEITATPDKTDEWKIKIIYVNLSTDQEANARKKFNGTVDIQKYSKLFAEYIKTTVYTGEQGKNNIYYHNNLENSAEDGSYRYAGSYESVNNYVCFGSDEESCPWDNMYRVIGVFGDNVKLIKADYAKAAELGIGGDYVGLYNSNGTNKGLNSLNEIGAYFWNNSNGNNSKNFWSDSRLNTINLNQIFLNKFDESWQSKIATTSWQVGGNEQSLIERVTPSVCYQNEIVSPITGQTPVNSKIGLMYVSDYGFAAAPSAWKTNLNYYYTNDILNNNWMYGGLMEWTITRVDYGNRWVCYVEISSSQKGYVSSTGSQGVYANPWAVRPVFYLTNDVTVKGGNGKLTDPYRLSQIINK